MPTINEMVAQVDTLRAEGKAVKTACEEVGLAKSTYWKRKKATNDEGVSMGNRRKHRSEEEKRELIRRVRETVAEGKTLKAAGQEHDINPTQLRAWVKELGEPRIEVNLSGGAKFHKRNKTKIRHQRVSTQTLAGLFNPPAMRDAEVQVEQETGEIRFTPRAFAQFIKEFVKHGQA